MFSVAQVLDFLGDRVLDHVPGSRPHELGSAAALGEAGPGQLAFAALEGLEKPIAESQATLILVLPQYYPPPLGTAATVIVVERPRREFARIMNWFLPTDGPRGVHPSALVSTGARLGAGTVVGAGAVIDDEVIVGADCRIGPSVTLLAGTRIGDRVTLGPGVVIGHYGFSYEREPDGTAVPIPHLAGVTIGSDVEIGANSCVDRGVFADTQIADGVKIDNLVQVGHNVRVGANSYVIALSVLCGSVEVGRDVWVGPGCTIMEHLRVGDGARIGMGSTVTHSVAPGVTVMGPQARPLPPAL